MATITPIKGKRGLSFRVRVRHKGVVESRTFKLKGDAERWARNIESDVDNDRYWSPSDNDLKTLKEALEKYSAEYSIHKAWPTVEQQRAKRLQKHPLAEKPLLQIDASDIKLYIKERTDAGIKNSTIRLELALLSQVFEEAHHFWKLKRLGNPVKQVKRPKPTKGVRRRFEEGELDTLCAAVPADLAVMVRLGIATAMRRSEICRLVWGDIDLVGRWIHNIEGKNGETESIPLSQAAIDALSGLKPGEPHARVFFRTPEYVTRRIYTACRKKELEGLYFHITRHEGTSQLFERGLPVQHVMAITRHKTPVMALRYNHTRKQDVKLALDRSDEILRQAQETEAAEEGNTSFYNQER